MASCVGGNNDRNQNERPCTAYSGQQAPITFEKNPRRVVVRFAGKIVADTTNAIVLKEASYPAVQYIPRTDVDMRFCKGPPTHRIARTKATLRTTASPLPAVHLRMQYGAMRRLTRPLAPSRITSRSIPIASRFPSRTSDQAPRSTLLLFLESGWSG